MSPSFMNAKAIPFTPTCPSPARSNMDPKISHLQPVQVLLEELTRQELINLNKTLCNALVRERESHALTKLDLNREREFHIKVWNDKTSMKDNKPTLDPFDLSFLQTPDLESDPSFSPLDRNLLRHFSDQSETVTQPEVQTPTTITCQRFPLIEVGSEETEIEVINASRRSEASKHTMTKELKHSLHKDMEESPRAANNGFGTSHRRAEISDQGPPGVTNGDEEFSDSTSAKIESINSFAASNTKLIKPAEIPFPYSTFINWAVTSTKPVFANDLELNAAKLINETPFSPFWLHPIRYLPDISERNLYRTLIIDFLPLNTRITDVLSQIRTGAIESIHLFPPIGNANDFKTARIVFHYEIPARELCFQAHKEGFKIKGKQVRVWQVLQPTYPKNRQLDEDVFMHQYTRLLLIDNLLDSVVDKLGDYLSHQRKMGFIVAVGKAHDGVPLVEFTSVVEAVRAMRRLQKMEEFRNAVFDFEDDYCEAA